jgi:acetyl esterase
MPTPPLSPADPPSLPTAGMADAVRLADRAPLPVRFHGRRPAHGETLPLVLHFHAGAFTGGGPDSGSTVARLLAEAGAVVVSLDYPLAPAHPFPEAAEAGHAVLAWLQRHRNRLAGPGAALWVAGEEAGGNLAAVVALMARDRGEPPLAGQILLSPMLDPCVATASLRQHDAGPVGCRWADGWHDYLSRASDANHPYAAPARVTRLADLPSSLLVTAGDDPMRDETLAYGARLGQAGIEVQTRVLDLPTGWPRSYMDAASIDAPWAATLREVFRSFLLAQTPDRAAQVCGPHERGARR